MNTYVYVYICDYIIGRFLHLIIFNHYHFYVIRNQDTNMSVQSQYINFFYTVLSDDFDYNAVFHPINTLYALIWFYMTLLSLRIFFIDYTLTLLPYTRFVWKHNIFVLYVALKTYLRRLKKTMMWIWEKVLFLARVTILRSLNYRVKLAA